MKRSIGNWQLMGFAITSLGGTLLHFLYELTGKTKWIAPFSGVNESTWEHMKLLFWPMLIYAVFQSFFFSEINNFWLIKRRGILLGLLLIPVMFYTYNGAIGKSPDWVNIAIFFIAAIVSFVWENRKFNDVRTTKSSKLLSFVILFGVALLFVIFTFYPPSLGIFIDPTNGTSGIQ